MAARMLTSECKEAATRSHQIRLCLRNTNGLPDTAPPYLSTQPLGVYDAMLLRHRHMYMAHLHLLEQRVEILQACVTHLRMHAVVSQWFLSAMQDEAAVRGAGGQEQKQGKVQGQGQGEQSAHEGSTVINAPAMFGAALIHARERTEQRLMECQQQQQQQQGGDGEVVALGLDDNARAVIEERAFRQCAEPCRIDPVRLHPLCLCFAEFGPTTTTTTTTTTTAAAAAASNNDYQVRRV